MPRADQHAPPAHRPVALKTVIEAHLDRILSSGLFKTADSLRELLRFTVHETLAGRGDDLKEYVLGATVLWKGDSFDPKADPIVRMQMGRLRQRLDRYYATDGRFDDVVIEIPKGTYTPTFRAGAARATHFTSNPKEHPIAGRQKEQAVLRDAFALASAGHGGFVCLSGEAGIGKTTVIEAFLGGLEASGADCYIARGRCSERLATSEAYLPLLEALETLLRTGGESPSRLMSAVAPTWYLQIAPLAGNPSADRVVDNELASQGRLMRELVAFFEDLARLRSVVLFLDDLHWADVSTIDVLSYVASRCESRRILILGAYRPSDAVTTDHPFSRVKLELQTHGRCREIPMPFLARADVDEYLALQFPGHLFSPELSARIYDRTEGNPLFMSDLLQFLRNSAVIVQRDAQWVMVGDLSQIERELPESVRSLVEKKIAELSEADRRLMSAAAVQGHEFDSIVVAGALEIDASEAEERLEVLDRAHGFVQLTGDRELPDSTLTLRYRFVHVLYQNAVYDALTATRKAALSMAVARSLMECYREQTEEVASQLGLLFEAGRDFGRASDFLLIAAQNAACIYAVHEAIALARRAIAAAEKLRGQERHSRVIAAALHAAAQLQSLSRFHEAAEDFEMAQAAAAEIGDCEAQVNAIYGKAYSLFLAKQLSDVREQGMRAMDLARTAGSEVAVASSNLILGIERWCRGENADEQLDRAIPVLRRSGPVNQAVDAVSFRGIIHSHRLEHEQADHDLQWAYTRAGEVGLTFDLLTTLYHHARTRGNQGRLSEAWSMLEKAQRIADVLDDRFWRPRLANTKGWLLAELLDREAALRLNREAASMASGLGDVEAECNSHINAAHDYLSIGEPARAWEHLEQAEAHYGRDVWFRWIYYPRLQAEMARFWIARGDLGRAISCARTSLEHAQHTLNRKRMASARALLGDIAVLEDRPEDARREFSVALQVLEHHACPILEWRIVRAAADAAGACRDSAGQDELLGRARATVRAIADSVREETLRTRFLASEPVRELGVGRL